MTSLVRRAALPVALGGAAVAVWLIAASMGDLAVEPAPAATSAEVDTPLLSVRRLGDYAESARLDRDLVAAVAAMDTVPTERSCVAVYVDGQPAGDLRGDLPLVAGYPRMLSTAYAALDSLGPDYRYETRLFGVAPTDGYVGSNLYLVGGGDPVLVTAAYRDRQEVQPGVFTTVDRLALAVVDLGVTAIGGSVVGVDNRYGGEPTLPGWPFDYMTSGIIGPLGALVIDDGFEAPEPDDQPPPDDAAADEASAVEGDGAAAAEQARQWIPATDPAAHAAALFDDLLESDDIAISGLARSDYEEDDLTGLDQLVSIVSSPLHEIVAQILATNDAGAAEMLVRELGVELGTAGTTQAGAEIVQNSLRGLGLDVLVPPRDGSGLDPVATTTCNDLAALAAAIPAGHLVLEAMPSIEVAHAFSGWLSALDLDGDVRVVGGAVGDTSGFIAMRAPTADEPPVMMVSLLNRDGGAISPDLSYQRNLLARLDDIAALAGAEELGLGE